MRKYPVFTVSSSNFLLKLESPSVLQQMGRGVGVAKIFNIE